MSYLKKIVKIYIIESPSSLDILDNRKEGFALSETLKLADIQNTYYNVVDKNTLIECLNRIALDIKSNDLGGIIIHFSMHGDISGVCLTSNEFITWKEFHSILDQFNNRLGYMVLPNELVLSKIDINLSTCEGFHANTINELSQHPVYTSFIGPVSAVNWSDSLIAFATLYHHTIHKESGLKIGVERMNTAAGLNDVFKIAFAKGLTFNN